MSNGIRKNDNDEPILLGGGPLGLGDPDDKRLRKVERDIIIPKRLKEIATNKCGETVRKFLECAQSAGLLMTVKCKEKYLLQEKCIAKWMRYDPLVKEVTDKYLEERSHYRRTGDPLHTSLNIRKKKDLPPPFDEEFPG